MLDADVVVERTGRQVLAVPECSNPPWGISATIGMRVLIHTQPTSSRFDIRIARPDFPIHGRPS